MAQREALRRPEKAKVAKTHQRLGRRRGGGGVVNSDGRDRGDYMVMAAEVVETGEAEWWQ